MNAVAGAAPVIYARLPNKPARLARSARVVALGIALGCLAVLLTAAELTPNPAGVGTHHTGLGLPDCQFLERTGIPCPSCGMTTSFSWFVRGNLLASLYIQPMATLLAAGAIVAFWLGLYVALTGRPIYRMLLLVPSRYYVVLPLLIGIAAWAWKIWIHTTGRDGWA